MADGFSQEWAQTVVQQLSERNVEFASGLTRDSIRRSGEAFGAAVLDELAQFLRAGLPTSPKWAPWADGPETVAQTTREYLDARFAFDITHG